MKKRIKQSDIESRKAELDKQKRIQDEKRLEQVTREVIEKLARGNYRGILEVVLNKNIRIENPPLEELANYNSGSNESFEVALAMRAYRMLGYEGKADSLKPRYDKLRHSEHMSDCADVWFK
ncbi:MAG: hypothetical protein ABIJ05_00265 [Patescibacteria group bacterium]